MANIIKFGGGGKEEQVKTVQRGMVSFASSETEKTIDISSIDMSKSIILLNGSRINTSVARLASAMFAPEILSNTQIKITRGASSSPDDCVVSWTVIEFKNFVSVQRGTAEILNISLDISISPINLNKSFVVSYAQTNQHNTNMSCRSYYLDLSDVNKLTAISSNIPLTVKWQVISFT